MILTLINKLERKRENIRIKKQMDLIKKIYEQNYEQNLEEDIIDTTSYSINPDSDSYAPKFKRKQILDFTEFVNTTSKGNNELLAYKYDFIDPDTGKTYTFRKIGDMWGYAEYLYRIEESKTIKFLNQTVDKKQNKSDSDTNLKQLYYKKNGDYYEAGLYIDPSKLHELFSNLTKETD